MTVAGLTLTPAMLFSWSNMLVRSFGLLLLLPYVFVRLELADALVWQLFTTILTIQILLDFGFNVSFVRAYGYVKGGLRQADYQPKLTVEQLPRAQGVDEQFLANLRAVSKRVYLLLAILSLLVMAVMGSWLLNQSISASTSPDEAWQAWLFLIVASAVRLYGNHYGSYLEGMDKIAVVQGWGTLFALLSVVSAAIGLYLTGSLLVLVVAYNLWMMLQVVALAILVSSLTSLSSRDLNNRLGNEEKRSLFTVLWQTSWRSGVGMMLTAGVTSLSGIVAANVTSQAFSTSYLFALQLMRTLSSLSQPPFYTRLPTLNRLYVSGTIAEVMRIAQVGMRGAYSVYLVVWVVLLVCGELLFEYIGSQVAFPTSLMMLILGLAFLAERFAAMHLQIYTLSNHVRWHQIAMVSSVLLVALTWMLTPILSDLAFPVGLLLANILFPVWFNARLSYRVLQTRFLHFERLSALPFLAVFLVIGLALISH